MYRAFLYRSTSGPALMKSKLMLYNDAPADCLTRYRCLNKVYPVFNTRR